jgi:hypothetical protein
MKEETTINRLKAINVGALTALGTFAPIDEKSSMMVITWTDRHHMRELLGTSSLKEGATGEVGQ